MRQAIPPASQPSALPLSRRGFLARVGAVAAAVAVSGCVTKPPLPPFAAKVALGPPIKNCFDSVGHQGHKPFVLGGTCYCNPLPGQFAVWRREGHLGDRSDEDVAAMYVKLSVKTLRDHSDCNNLCEWGPHVVKGGTCMVPPTPFTDNYEQVARGEWPKA